MTMGCDECGADFVVSGAVYYRRLKEERVLCRKCHTNLIGKKSEKVALGREKARKTNLERYGVDNPAKSEAVQEKTKRTNLKKYGVEWAIGSSQVKEKIKKSNIRNHGVACTFNDPKQQIKTKETLVKKYGVDNIAKTEWAKAHSRATCLRRYGVEYVTQIPEVRSKQRAKHMYDDRRFDSLAEVYLYAMLKKANVSFTYQKRLPEKYFKDGKWHIAIVDFYIVCRKKNQTSSAFDMNCD